MAPVHAPASRDHWHAHARRGGRTQLLLTAGICLAIAAAASLLALRNSAPSFATIIMSALLPAAGIAIACLVYRVRMLKAALRAMERRIDELSDRAWELRESEERARAFLEAQGDLIVRRTRDGTITYANDAFCRLVGRRAEALVGTRAAPDILEQGDTAILTDGSRIHDQKVACSDGPRWIAWRDVAVRSDESHSEIQSVGRDVTDRVNAEHALAEARDQAEAASRAKSRFLATVSHEVRTPLNGILGMADLLLETKLTPEQATYAKAVKTSGDTLLSLIEEILDFSKIESGKLDIEARPFALGAMIEDMVELLAPRAQAKGIEIAAYVDERLPERATGDATRLRQVLINLAGNAIKFTEEGGVAIVAEPGIWPGDVTFKVRDTGIGIAPEQQSRIFREFEQGESSLANSGTGLGLAISRQIVERMGGAISVESMSGAGALFEFTVNLPAVDEAPAAFAAPDLTGHVVMIVAPAAIEATLLARRLTRWGASVTVVPNEGAAAALLPERTWHTLLADHALGAEALDRLLAMSAPIERRLVLTTPAARGELDALRQAGFTGYLVKPVRAASLAARLQPFADGFAGPAQEHASSTSQTMQHGLSILVAEDNEINALLTRALLTKLHHRSTLATDGAQVTASFLAAHAAGTPHDLILMDVRMDGVDGLEAARRIRAAEAANNWRRTPIVALTANALPEHREACLAAGMDGFLTKPLDRERLEATLVRHTAVPPIAA